MLVTVLLVQQEAVAVELEEGVAAAWVLAARLSWRAALMKPLGITIHWLSQTLKI
jgi:hypothetical protein